jgi:malate dehydrogenase (oxaloacetate-decarboxylating)(NADP+)
VSTLTTTGYALLRNPRLNRGTAFTIAERRDLGLEGLLPPAALTLEIQLARLHMELAELDSDLQHYLLLSDLQVRNEILFYALLMSDPARFMPIVYTPMVGEACQKFDHFYPHPRGMYLRKRHGHTYREARALHRLRRRAAAILPAVTLDVGTNNQALLEHPL